MSGEEGGSEIASGGGGGVSGSTVCNFFKKPSKVKNIRKRTDIEEGEAEEDHDSKGENWVFNKKKVQMVGDNTLQFCSGPLKSSKEHVEASSVFRFESSREILQVRSDEKATATLETETEFSKDARAIRERTLKQADEASLKEQKQGGGGGDENLKVYKGLHGYTDYKAGFRRENTVATEKAGGAHGPLRASAYARPCTRIDYQHDICKDYKQTGFCGYGDSCKFLHDR